MTSFWDDASSSLAGHQVSFPAPMTPGNYTAEIYVRVFFPSLYSEPSDDDPGGVDMFGCYNTAYKNTAGYLHNFHLIDTKRNWYEDFAGIAKIPFTVAEATTANLTVNVQEGKGYIYQTGLNGIPTDPNIKLVSNVAPNPRVYTYSYGDKVTLKAVPYSTSYDPYEFKEWNNACNYSLDKNNCEVLMNGNKTAGVAFEIPPSVPVSCGRAINERFCLASQIIDLCENGSVHDSPTELNGLFNWTCGDGSVACSAEKYCQTDAVWQESAEE
jgi:hypothetical protein